MNVRYLGASVELTLDGAVQGCRRRALRGVTWLTRLLLEEAPII